MKNKNDNIFTSQMHCTKCGELHTKIIQTKVKFHGVIIKYFMAECAKCGKTDFFKNNSEELIDNCST